MRSKGVMVILYIVIAVGLVAIGMRTSNLLGKSEMERLQSALDVREAQIEQIKESARTEVAELAVEIVRLRAAEQKAAGQKAAVATPNPQREQQIITDFETAVLEQREKIEGYIADEVALWGWSLQILADDTGSSDEESFDMAVDNYESLVEDAEAHGFDCIADDILYHAIYAHIEPILEASYYTGGETPQHYRVASTDDGRISLFEVIKNILWEEGKSPIDEMPDSDLLLKPFSDKATDIPSYEGSPRFIEDRAEELYEGYEDADRTEEERATLLYNEWVARNAEVLERRGFFNYHPLKIER